MKRGNLYQNLRIEGQLKFKKLNYSNYMMGYRLPQYRRGLKLKSYSKNEILEIQTTPISKGTKTLLLFLKLSFLWYRPPQYWRGLKHHCLQPSHILRYRLPQYQKLRKIDFIGLILVWKYKKWRKPKWKKFLWYWHWYLWA